MKFSEKFKEVKDAARLAREKSQDKELANTALSIAAPQVSSGLSGNKCKHESRAGLCRCQAGSLNVKTLSWATEAPSRASYFGVASTGQGQMNAPVTGPLQLNQRWDGGKRKEKQKKDELGHLSRREVKVRKTRTVVKLSLAAQQSTSAAFSTPTASEPPPQTL